MAAGPTSPQKRPVASVGLSRSFLLFLGGSLVSQVGDALYTFALPWIAYELTRSALVLGLLYAIEIVPILLFGALAGVYVDRWNRRRLLLMADVLRAVLVALVPLLHLFGLLQVWHLYVIAFSLALISLAFDVAITAVTPELAGGNLTRANAAYQMVVQTASLAGPALAGALIATLGGFQVLWLDALSFGGTFLVVLGLPSFQQQALSENARSVFGGLREGMRWLWQNRVIRVLSLQAMTGNFGFGMVSAVLLFYLRATLGLSAQLSGFDYAMLGLGGLLGSIAIVPLGQRFRKGQLYPLILLFGMAGLLVMVSLSWWWAPGLGFGMVAACNVAWVVLSTSVRQTLIPGQLFGRVLSFSRILSTAAMPVGAIMGGLITQTYDPRVVFLLAAAAKGVEVLIALRSSMRKLP